MESRQNLFCIFFAIFLLMGCQSNQRLLSPKEESFEPVDIDIKESSAPAKISPEERQNLREWLSVFYKGSKKKEWKEAREKIINMGAVGKEAICIFMLKFFYGGKKKVSLEDRDEDLAKYWEEARDELVYLKEDAVPYILYAMSHPSIGSTGRMLCSQALVKIGKSSVSPLIQNLEKGPKAFRRMAMETLAKIGSPDASRAIAKLYLRLPRPATKLDLESEDDEDFDLRFSAIKSLGILASSDGLAAIEKAFDDPNPLIVKEAFKAILNYDIEEAIPILKKALEKAKDPGYIGFTKKIERKLSLLELP